MSAATPVPYCGAPRAIEHWPMAWNLDPWLLLALALMMFGLWRVSGGRRAWPVLLAAVLLFVSPLCAATSTLLSMRTLHHLGVMLCLAPLLARALPLGRGHAGGWALATAVLMALWYVPGVYSLAWVSASAYWVLQLASLLAAWGLWSALQARPATPEPLLDAVAAIGLLVLAMGMLGALLTFAPQPLLVEHLLASPLAGMSARDDQRLAGLLMWVLAMLPLAWLAATRLQRMVNGQRSA